MSTRIRRLVVLLFFATLALTGCRAASHQASMPNVVLIFTDDQGYSDVGCFGAEGFVTPHIDELARQGTRFTRFYVPQSVCTASRAGLMTGCYPNRVSLFGALNHTSTNGIHPDETILPELFKSKGYATAIYGKWHLGTKDAFNPLNNGFDEYLGIPYSNDNTKYHPVFAKEMPPLPLYDGRKIIEYDPDQSQFTKRCTQRAVEFIHKNKDGRFFVYMPHIMPHVPIFASDAFKGQAELGLYGDVIEELDWSVGQIMKALREAGVEKNTLVIFCSDNGPFLSYGSHAGTARPLREGKLTTFEGGVRVPCVMRWPGRIPAGAVNDKTVCTIDLLPTMCELIGAPLPKAKIDGVNAWPVLAGEQDADRVAPLFFYAGQELQAVQLGHFKLHFAHQYLTVAGEPGRDGKPSNWGKLTPNSLTQSGVEGIASRHGYRVTQTEMALFNLKDDPGETKNVAGEHPDMVALLSELAGPIRKELGDKLTNVQGNAIRPAGQAQ